MMLPKNRKMTTLRQILELLAEYPAGMTVQQMVDVTGLNYNTTMQVTKSMKKDKLLYTDSWTLDSRGHWQAVFARPDCPEDCPKPDLVAIAFAAIKRGE
jgi:IclR helix-turn-helix domain